LDRKKNLEGLLRAVALIDVKALDLTLLIAGDGPSDYVASLKSLAQSLKIQSHVVWLGHIDGAAKAAALARADIYVLPSFSENFGISVVEALIEGLPCVLGEGVAIAEEVRVAGAGVVVSPDPTAIADAIGCLLYDSALRRTMGMKAAKLAQDNFSPLVMGERLIALYIGIRGEGSGSSQ
jgi:glycosyltransferase involved in cell wall biosynthesis